jgi:hypothetical protein
MEFINGHDWDVQDLEADQSMTRQELEKLSKAFPGSCVGKYVVARDPDKNKSLVPVLYLVDRRKTTQWWWSCNAKYAYVIPEEERAKELAARYRGTNVRVVKITEDMVVKEEMNEITW